MPSGRVLVVAPNSDLRTSLAFALEADGYELTVKDAPPPRSWLVTHRFDCTILDQKALTGEPYESIALCIKAHPIVLLANHPHPWLVEWVEEIVDLPLAANDVASAIRRAMHLDI